MAGFFPSDHLPQNLPAMSLGYLLPCSCGKKIAIQKSQAGQEVACECGKTLQVPTLRGLNELELVQESTAKPGAKRGASSGSRTWNPVRGFPAAIVFFLSVLCLAIAGYYAYGRYQLITYLRADYTVEDQVRDGMTKIDELSAADLWQQFRGMRDLSLQHVEMPDFYLYYLMRLEYESMLKYCLIGSAVTFLIGLAIIYWPQGRVKAKG